MSQIVPRPNPDLIDSDGDAINRVTQGEPGYCTLACCNAGHKYTPRDLVTKIAS